MSTPTLSVLTAAPTLDQIRTKLLSYLQVASLPITDWEPGAFMRTLLEVVALGVDDLVGETLPSIVSAGFPESTGKAGASDWVELVAGQWFAKDRVKATFAQQTVVLTCDASHGPFTIVAGTLWVTSTRSGNRYVAATGGTLPTGGTLTITVKAEMANDSMAGRNYVDTANTLTRLVDPIPGVTCNNPPPSFSAVSTVPSPATGMGIVTIGGTPAANPTSYEVIVSSSGQKAAAQIQSRVNGGAWSAPVTMGATFVFAGGPTLTFTDDTGGTSPSFVVGDLYSFTSPGSPITSPGFDRESDRSLLARCLARWPLLTAGAVEEKRFRWAKEASPLVTRARVFPHGPSAPGQADVIIAGVTNPLGGAVVTAVQDYIDERDQIGDRTVVFVASIATIAVAGSVNYPRNNLPAILAAATVAWNAYVLGTDIGGVVRLAELEQALMDAGALDVGVPAGGALTINGGAGHFAANFQLDPATVGNPAALTSLTWNPI